MKLSEIKEHLATRDTVNFILPTGEFVPAHFHVTEVGVISKRFIDCGGTVRNEKVVNFQLWNATDFEHRLKPQTLIDIIKLSENVLGIEDLEIEVEYQTDTIGKYGLHFNGETFALTRKLTACLAQDECDVTLSKQKKQISTIKVVSQNSCTPGGNCC